MQKRFQEEFIDLFQSGDIVAAQEFLRRHQPPSLAGGYQAHPLLLASIRENNGHCYRPQHLAIADLLIPENVRSFRRDVLKDNVGRVERRIASDAKLVAAEFTAGRGIAQAIHHWRSIPMADLLLQAGADIHTCTTVHFGDETPLALKLREGNESHVRFLLERGANPNRGVSHAIPSRLMHVLIPLLLKHGWEINAGESRRRTMLHHDANHGHGKRIATWLKYGADPNVPDAGGKTALHILAMRGSGGRAMRALVEAGANVDALDDDGHAPLDLAISAKHQSAAEELISLQATRKG